MATMKIPLQKIILCGEYGAGKSSIFRRFTNNTFVTSTDRSATLGLDHFEKGYTIDQRHLKLQVWDTGGMERIASVTSSYYKFAEAAILVFALDNPASFHALSHHVLEIVTYAENAKIVLCGNKMDLDCSGGGGSNKRQVTDEDIEIFCEQCQNLICATFKISCKTGEGIEEMFQEIGAILIDSNRSRLELKAFEHHGFRIQSLAGIKQTDDDADGDKCIC